MHALSTTMTAVADQEIFTRLLEQHGGIIHKVALGYTGTFADREDLIQEITLQLWRAYPRYSADRPFSTWMYRIALNVAISFLRRHTRPVRQTLSLEENEIEVVDETAGRNDPDERIALLRQVIASLAPLDRGLLLLYLDDHSYREIAAILGLTETNVATKLNRLKERVRAATLKLNRQNS
ncbi:MAG: sigma-70 family RNA polymerase sigma factor [Chthoniobacterales bacterium]